MIKTLEGDLQVANTRFCLVVSRFNAFVVESLLAGAIDTLKRHGADESDLVVVRVPGAFEMPLIAPRRRRDDAARAAHRRQGWI